MFFFVKQKTAYELRNSDWSSDVCSSELFVQAGLDDARTRGLDGIVCGHIHRAALLQRDGLIYANDGDWVESLSALSEDEDGTLRLLSQNHESVAEIAPRQRTLREIGRAHV